MKKIKKEKKTTSGFGTKVLLVVGFIALLVSVVIYGLLITTENAVLGKYDRKTVYIATQDIEEGTKITENIFVKKSVDAEIVPENAITDINSVKDTYTKTFISQNSIITANDFGNISDVETGTKMVGFGISDLASGGVNGIIRTSDYVDIYVEKKDFNFEKTEEVPEEIYTEIGYVEEEAGKVIDGKTVIETSYELAEPTYKHIYVSECFTKDGVKIENSDKTSLATNFNIVLPEEDANYLINALMSGWKVYIVLNQE